MRRTAIVTGRVTGLRLRAGQGVGRRRMDGGDRRAIDAAAVDAAAAALGPGVVGVAGDVADRTAPAELVRRRERARHAAAGDQQRQRARPVAAAEPGRLPARRAARGVRGRTSSRRSALVQAALPALRRTAARSSTSPPTPASRATPAGAATARRRPRWSRSSNVLAAEEPDVRGVLVRPRRHAHADAPGGVPRRGHLRPAAAGDGRCPALVRLLAQRRAERPLPGRIGGVRRAGDRRRRSAVVNALTTPRGCASTCRRRWRPASRPRPGASRRDGVRMLVAAALVGRADAHHVRPTCRRSSTPATSWWSTPPACCRRRSTPTAPDGSAVVVHLSTRLDDGRWVVELRRPDGGDDRPLDGRRSCRST